MTWAFPLSPGVRRPETSFRHQQEWGRAAESDCLFQLSALSRSRDRSVPQVAPDHSERGSQRGSDLDFHGKSDAQSFGLLCPLPELLHQSRPPSSARQGGAQCVGRRGEPREKGKRGAGGGCREGGAASQTAEPSQASVRPPAWPPPAMSRASGVHLTGTGLPGRSCRSCYLLESSLESLAGAQAGFRGAAPEAAFPCACSS